MAARNSGGGAPAESLGSKILLMVLDKIVLGGLIGGVVLLATTYADHLKTAWSFQEKDIIFTQRLAAFGELQHLADKTLEAVALDRYAPRDPDNKLPFNPWPATMAAERGRYEALDQPESGGSGGDIADRLPEMIAAPTGLVEARQRHALLVRSHLDATLTDFVRTMSDEL